VVARMWHEMTPTGKADEYSKFLVQRAIPDYRGTPGNLAAYFLRREDGGKTHFITLTFWESLEKIKAFAGEPVYRAKHYAEDKNFCWSLSPRCSTGR
jgi:heme-degrading monooxygenase HmoA